jgi:hypothetical protein
MPSREKATPQDLAREVLSQVHRAEPMQRKRKDGTEYFLDTREISTRAAQRMGDCGTFPKGKVSLFWKDGGRLDLGAHQCNSRICPRCARRRGIRLASDMAGALALIEGWGWDHERTRFATLTIENTESANEGIDRVMEAWHRTLATKTWGRLIAGGFRAVEVKPGKNGKWNVHLHAILYLWTPAVPYRLIRDAWDKAAGGNYNQRFDTLRNKARAHKGESKASAAARYLVKYLVKHEELKGTRRMPGGLPHFLGAIEGRRLFGAWGLGAAALRIERHERPRWTGTYDRNLQGYVMNGLGPERAELETPWGARMPVEIPMPTLPAAFSREDVPEQMEPKGKRWTVRKVNAQSPLTRHRWRDLPMAHAKTAAGMKTALESWLENPKSRGPKPFRWRAWYAGSPKEWTEEAAAMLGERIITPSIGAVLWSRVQAPAERFPQPDHPEHITHQVRQAYAQRIREHRRSAGMACGWPERVAYLAQLPEDLRQHLETKHGQGNHHTAEWGAGFSVQPEYLRAFPSIHAR